MNTLRLFLSAITALGIVASQAEAYSETSVNSNLKVQAVGNPTPMPKPKFLAEIPNALISTNDTNGLTIDLTKHFKAAPAPSDTLFVTTSLGNFYMQLLPSNAPATVANFLRYVSDGAYENTLVHRRVDTPDVIETGQYTLNDLLSPIATWDPITNEYNIPNTLGTVAMYKPGGDPNGATSGWFINLADNTSLLDTNNNGGYTVFAQILGNGMESVLDNIAALPAENLSNLPNYGSNTPFTSIPLQKLSIFQTNVYLNNFVAITHVITLPYFAVSSDPAAYSTEIQGTNLIVQFLSYSSNDVTITAYATDTNGNSIHTSFAVAPTPKGSQTITFPAALQQQYSRQPYTFNNYSNYPTASSGLEPYVTLKSGPAKIAGDQFYFTGVGTITLIAHQLGNTSYNAAANVTNSIVVTKADQTITPFPSIASTNVTKFPYSFTLPNLPTASSGLPVKILITGTGPGPGPVKISGKKITLTTAQQVTLTAEQVGNSLYYPAPKQTTNFTISPQTVPPTGGSNTYTGTTTLNGGSLSDGSGTTSLGGSNNLINGAGANSISTSNSVAQGSSGFTQSNTVSDSTYGGSENGAGALPQSGSGTLVLAGDNNYTGDTTIAGRVHTLSGSNGLHAPTP